MEGKRNERFRTEYKRRIKLILKSNLNSRNTISAINNWAVAVMRDGAGKSKLLKAVHKQQEMNNDVIKASEYKDQRRRDREVKWHEKVMHGQFLRDTDWLADKEKSRLWLKNGDLKKETDTLKKESFINATRQKGSQILTELILIIKNCSSL